MNGKVLEMVLMIVIVLSLVLVKLSPKMIRIVIAWVMNFLYGVLVHSVLCHGRKYGFVVSFVMLVVMVVITLIALE